MIQTTLEQMNRYTSMHPRFADAFCAISRLAQQDFWPGITEVDGKHIFINAFGYKTHSEEVAQYEAHRSYIDIMYMKRGMEQIAWCPVEQLGKITKPYCEQTDVLLASWQPACSVLTIREGDVAIFFPEDAHSPGLHANVGETVEKLVAKVRI